MGLVRVVQCSSVGSALISCKACRIAGPGSKPARHPMEVFPAEQPSTTITLYPSMWQLYGNLFSKNMRWTQFHEVTIVLSYVSSRKKFI
jgi:hypothetical protein